MTKRNQKDQRSGNLQAADAQREENNRRVGAQSGGEADGQQRNQQRGEGNRQQGGQQRDDGGRGAEGHRGGTQDAGNRQDAGQPRDDERGSRRGVQPDDRSNRLDVTGERGSGGNRQEGNKDQPRGGGTERQQQLRNHGQEGGKTNTDRDGNR